MPKRRLTVEEKLLKLVTPSLTYITAVTYGKQSGKDQRLKNCWKIVEWAMKKPQKEESYEDKI